jgi:hypothetical protein
LPEDLGQLHDGHRAGSDNVGQDGQGKRDPLRSWQCRGGGGFGTSNSNILSLLHVGHGSPAFPELFRVRMFLTSSASFGGNRMHPMLLLSGIAPTIV